MRMYVYERPDEYIENINSLIRAVETIENMHLILYHLGLKTMNQFHSTWYPSSVTRITGPLLVISDTNYFLSWYGGRMFQKWKDRVTVTDIVMWMIGGTMLLLCLWGSVSTIRAGLYTSSHWIDFCIFGLSSNLI